MKKNGLLLTFLLVQSSLVFAQFTLEHAYIGQYVSRYNLPTHGELYFAPITTDAPTFGIYGRDHNIWRQIPVVGKPNRRKTIYSFLETPNGALRFLMNEYDSLNTVIETLYLSDDIGNILLSHPYYPSADSVTSMNFLRTIGLPDRLMLTISNRTKDGNNFKLYDLDGKNLKMRSFQNSYSFKNLTRIKLEVSGEKFYRTNGSDSIFFYNADLSFWKKFKIGSGEFFNIGQTYVNADSLIEVVILKYYYPSACSPPCTMDSVKFVAINELEQEVSSLRIPKRSSSISDDEQIAMIADNGSLNLYNFRNGIRLAKNFPTRNLRWYDVKGLGRKYLSYNYDSDTLFVYNDDFSLWKTIKIPFTPNFTYNRTPILFVPENSNLLHIALNEYRWMPNNASESNVKIINEKGDVLLFVSDAGYVVPSQFDGIATKILVYGEKQNWTRVYAFSATNATTNLSEKLNAQVFPNPFNNTLTIKLDAPQAFTSDKLSIQVIDLLGKIVLTKTAAVASEIPLPEAAEWAKGFYFLQITAEERSTDIIGKGGTRQVVLKVLKE